MTQFRLVGIRTDKNRMVICERLTAQQAERTRKLMEHDHVYLTVEVEAQEFSGAELQLSADRYSASF